LDQAIDHLLILHKHLLVLKIIGNGFNFKTSQTLLLGPSASRLDFFGFFVVFSVVCGLDFKSIDNLFFFI